MAISSLTVDRAADVLIDAILDVLRNWPGVGTERGIHIETAITAAGATAGAWMLRQTGVDVSGLSPGSAVLGTGVDERGPAMIEHMVEVATRVGLDGQTGWAIEVPAENKTLIPGLELEKALRPAIAAVAAEYELPASLYAYVAASAAVRLVWMGRKALDPEVGKALALASLMAGAKTVPLAEG